MSRVAVVGVGAVGGTLAAALAGAGHTMLLASRARFRELVFTHGDITVRPIVTAVTEPAELDGVRLVVLATKAHQTGAALRWLSPSWRAGVSILVAQNGVDQRERTLALLGEGAPSSSVVPAVVQGAFHRDDPGRFTLHGSVTLVLPDEPASVPWLAAFDDTFVRVRAAADWLTPAWTKLALNASSGAVCALTGRPIGVFADPDARALAVGLVREVFAVGRAEGATLPEPLAETLVDRMLDGFADHLPSIALDRAQGVPTEWQIRNEVVVRRAAVHGIPVPLNAALTTLLRLGEP